MLSNYRLRDETTSSAGWYLDIRTGNWGSEYFWPPLFRPIERGLPLYIDITINIKMNL